MTTRAKRGHQPLPITPQLQLGHETDRRHLRHDDGWDYPTADTKELTHDIHPYPAMMIPPIAKRLVKAYGHRGGLLFDPYCGSGTTLLEGMLAGMAAVGTDLNPLARLIARVKTTRVNIDDFDEARDRFQYEGLNPAAVPNIPNISYWFAPDVQRDLASVNSFIGSISSQPIADAFRIALSITARKSSWTRLSQFKLHRMPIEQMASHNPNVYALMKAQLDSLRARFLLLAYELRTSFAAPKVHSFNTVTGIPQCLMPPESVDLVVTSPPYGDSRTTVAYGQFSRLSSQWLGYSEADRVDTMLMGGIRANYRKRFRVPQLDTTIAAISALDQRRALDVVSFFDDYSASIHHTASAVKPGGHACYVVGNRTVKGHVVPTAAATAALLEHAGFETVDVLSRNIPTKRMPSLNSPSNVPGQKGRTMTTENIVISRKRGAPCS